ncbi:MAG: hypothetical protein O9340_02125 [Cyclobacteriaceae bacterium]|nr:hypothetical protein [Cyclobacteriaceae bacterium]
MKKIILNLLFFAFGVVLMTSCVEEQDDLTYNGPTVAEFKNRYLEQQIRLGTTLFQSVNYNVVTLENTALNRLTVRQPAVQLSGVITTATNSPTVNGQVASTFTGSITGTNLTVTTAPTGGALIVPGMVIAGTGIAANTSVIRQLSGSTGLAGTYVVSAPQTVASTTVSIPGTAFTTELAVGSILKSSTGIILGVVATIVNDNQLTLAANSTTALTRSFYRASFANGINAPTFRDSILVQLVGPQRTSDVTVTYELGTAPEGTIAAVEGDNFAFDNEVVGEVTIKAGTSAGYIYINIPESLNSTAADRVVLVINLTDQGDVAPSQNYKAFTYTITK